MDLSFTWHAEKARANLRKHAIGFAEAATVLGDPLSLTVPDPIHSVGEERWIDVGMSSTGRLMVGVYVEHGSQIGIISARLADRDERNNYEEASRS